MERKSSKPSTSSNWFIFMITAGMVTAGSLATILGKVMDQKVMIPDQSDGVVSGSMIETEFKHPLLMNFLMFMGEASLLFVLQIQLKQDPIAAAVHEKNKANPVLFAAPALLDTFGSFLNFTGLMLISASSYQILKMLCMVFVVLLSVIVFRRVYSLAQYLALLVVISGLTVVTLSDVFTASSASTNPDSLDIDNKNDYSMISLGIICVVYGSLFHAIQSIVEESILKWSGAAGQEPCYMMGWEGVFGIIITILITIPAQFTSCPFHES